jgi:hypothetical protein
MMTMMSIVATVLRTRGLIEIDRVWVQIFLKHIRLIRLWNLYY